MTSDRPVFEFEQQDGVLIITPNGPFMEFRDHDVRNAYNDAYRILSGDDIRHLVVDFSRLDYFGSTFVGILLRLAKKVRGDGGQAVLCNLSDTMRDMLKSLMLLENEKISFAWSARDTREAALASLNT